MTTLHSFDGTDGSQPVAGLVQATDGTFYGTTLRGGTHGDGTVFKITPEGTLTTVLSFNGTDGANPVAGLVQATDGKFYGTAEFGAASNNCPVVECGTVFKLTVTVQTPQQETQAIINSVNALYSQGVLNRGQDNSLVVKLQHAINMMNAGKNAGAIGNLDSFISEVNDLLSSGVLSPSRATSLISVAERVIAQLS